MNRSGFLNLFLSLSSAFLLLLPAPPVECKEELTAAATATAAAADGSYKEGRIFTNEFINNETSITVGIVTFYLASALLLGLLLFAILPFLIPLGDYHGGTTGYGTTGYADSSYSSYARAFDPSAIDWETLSILDWIEIAEETWRKFDPKNLDCQKRVICEIHQNMATFGIVAKRMVDAFSYLEYAEILSLPEPVKALLDEYLDAAKQGRNSKKKCGDLFSGCDYSVKSTMERVISNEI